MSNNDPNSDERVLKDAQKTIERVVEAMRTALDDELALQQMEYDQVFGINSMQFAMYQTLVMTFFQDHQMLAGLNLKRSRPDLSQGVPEQKRAYLMGMIAERVASAPSSQEQQNQNVAPQPVAPQPSQGGFGQTADPWGQQAQPATPAPAANWLEPQPAAQAQPNPGDWLNQSNSTERPPSKAWPQASDDSSTWTLKPGGGQPPALPAPSGDSSDGSNGAAWAAAANSWPTPESQAGGSSAWPAVPEQPKPAASTWADQPGGAKQPPPAAWPASNNGGAPAPAPAIALPQPPVAPLGVARPAFSSPIGESGQSGTWSLPPDAVGFTKPVPGQPPAPAWDSNSKPVPAASAWNEPGISGNEPSNMVSATPPAPAWGTPGAPAQEIQQWNPGAHAPATAPSPAWSAPTSGMPVPESAPAPVEQPAQWQPPAAPSSTQARQTSAPGPAPAPSWQVPPASVTQSQLPAAQAPAPAQPAWEAPPAYITQNSLPAQPQAWQPPHNPSMPQPWQQPAAPTLPPQPQMPQSQPQPWQNQSPAAAAPWDQPGQTNGQQQYIQPGQPQYGQVQNGQQPPQIGQPQPLPMPPQVMPQQAQPQQAWTPPETPWGTPPAPDGNGAAPPWAAQNGMPLPAGSPQPPAGYPGNNGQQYPANGQGQAPNQVGLPPQAGTPPNSIEDMSINFNQNNQPNQNAGGTLSGVLRQMRSNEVNKKREDETSQESYNPNTAW
jgi:hypothetical protein